MTRLVVSLVCFLIPVTAAASPPADNAALAMPQAYTAVYEVTRKDRQVAKVTLELSRQGEQWTYRGFTHDMQGLGKLLHVEGRQRVTGNWRNGHFQPDHYEFSFKLVGFKDTWQADFDWPAKTVTVAGKSDTTTLSLASGAMDPLSLFLNTGQYLSEGREQMDIDLIDGDEIKNHLYKAEEHVPLDTILGCLDTARVQRVRENSKRVSLAWYAQDLGYIPVMLHHYKKKGRGMRVKIISLSVGGQDMQVPGSCPADTGEFPRG